MINHKSASGSYTNGYNAGKSAATFSGRAIIFYDNYVGAAQVCLNNVKTLTVRRVVNNARYAVVRNWAQGYSESLGVLGAFDDNDTHTITVNGSCWIRSMDGHIESDRGSANIDFTVTLL